ncbi:MAG: ABC transporter ATP-binding protein [Acidimicrobiia bacterium]
MWRAMAGQRRHLLVGTALLMIHQVCESLVPVVIGAVIDRATETGDSSSLIRWLVLLAVLFAVLSAAWFTNATATERACQGAEHDTRMAVGARVLHLGGGAERAAKVGKLVSIANSDSEEVGLLGDHVPGAFGALAAVVLATVFLFSVDPGLGVLVLIGLPPVLATEKLFADRLVDRWTEEQEESAEAASVATDLMSGLRVIKGLGAEAAAAQRYRKASRLSLAATLRTADVEAFSGAVSTLLTGAFLALVALVGGRMASGGRISIGDFVAAVGLTQFLVSPLETLGSVITNVAESRASAERVAKVLGTPPATVGGPRGLESRAAGRLFCHRVSLGKLKGFDLRAGPGELVGVAIADSSAARSLAACLAREAEPEAGTMEVDGVGFADLSLASWRAAVLVADHDATLFEGSLVDNVLLQGDSEPGRLEAAMSAAGAGQVAATLPAGFETNLGERGRFLSGGQSQRVALARALAADPPVLVLHDPTTAVDAATEHAVAGGLRAIRQERTTLVITTSPVLLAACTRVVFVARKGVKVYGTHESLADAEQGYRDTVLA